MNEGGTDREGVREFGSRLHGDSRIVIHFVYRILRIRSFVFIDLIFCFFIFFFLRNNDFDACPCSSN